MTKFRSLLYGNIFCFFILFINGCTPQENGGQTIIRTYYDDGKVRTEKFVQITEDSAIDKTLLVYYENGQIETQTHYINNIKQGESKTYYESGGIRSIEHFKDDLADGQATWYGENGKVLAKNNSKAGKPIGEAIWYYDNGAPKIYQYHDAFEKLMYQIDYDVDGNALASQGIGFPEIYISYKTVSVGDTFKMYVMTIDPPYTDPKLQVDLIDSTDNTTIKVNPESINGNKHSYSYIFDHQGLYTFKLLLDLNTDLKNITTQYYQEVEVRLTK